MVSIGAAIGPKTSLGEILEETLKKEPAPDLLFIYSTNPEERIPPVVLPMVWWGNTQTFWLAECC